MITFILFLTCACLKSQAQTNIITTIAGVDTAGYCCDGEPAIIAKMNYPFFLCVDNFDNLIIVDAFNNRIRKIDNSTGIITTIAGCCDTVGYSGDNGPATNAKLFIPEAAIIDSNGNMYIADAGNMVIRKIDASTNIITTFAGNGIAGSAGDGGPAIAAELNAPAGLWFDKFGSILVGDEHNKKIRKIDIITGIITTVAGNGNEGYTGDHGPATNAEISLPGAIFCDSSNNIIFPDYGNNVIRRIDAATGVITTIAGTGVAGYFGDNGPATDAEFYMPIGIFIDQQQNIFIADDENGAVRKIDAATGIITTVAGTGIPGYSGNGGPATAAQVIPTDIYFNSGGDMYIADAGNNCIRKVQSGLGTQNLIKQDAISIYPNPVNDVLHVDGDVVSYKIMNIVGGELLQGGLKGGGNSIDVSAFAPGIYMLAVIDGEGVKTVSKIVKE